MLRRLDDRMVNAHLDTITHGSTAGMRHQRSHGSDTGGSSKDSRRDTRRDTTGTKSTGPKEQHTRLAQAAAIPDDARNFTRTSRTTLPQNTTCKLVGSPDLPSIICGGVLSGTTGM